MKYVVIHPKIAEESAHLLAEALDCPCINPYETKDYMFSKKNYDLVINYGVSSPTKGAKKLNKSAAVKLTKNKLECFDALEDTPKILHTTDYNTARAWIQQGRTVVVRKVIDADNSKGIFFCNTLQQLGKHKDAPLFTRYIEHTNEYRVNVFQGKVLSVYDKTVVNGFFKFKLQVLMEKTKKLQEIAKIVYEKTGIDWCGIDLLKTAKGNYFILEVNSAPILFPYTIKKLVHEIKQLND